ncbi:hypothetical protein ACFPOD_15175 [Nitratireductor kimnyeongensis]|uniref:Transcriptional regulator n=1 Tax=Nitratireductor kimnyeongensis TaxID=430679 RepID=A0ABW0TC31_9HYPH|nr:hypothetical protein [Nitratireductor kimnyeongensis]QZZ36737.1 hypothetical protein KW403_06315 [Nitratireductor kimnyeongensis]
MADFSAVLKKTIDALSENTPAARERIYQKARATIENKLKGMDPAPSTAVADRQRKLLEDAIARVEAEYAPPPAPEEPAQDELDQIFAELDVDPAKPRDPVPSAFQAQRTPPEPASFEDRTSQDAGPEPVDGKAGQAARVEAPSASGAEPALETPPPPPRRKSGKGGATGLIAGVVLLLAALVAGAWFYKDDLTRLAGFDGAEQTLAENGESAPVSGGETSGDNESAAPAPSETGNTDASQQPAQPEPVQKFTQRLLADGREVDEGPAGGEPGLGEGTSVAQATVPNDGDAIQPPPSQGSQTESPGPSEALPVGQKAIYYEERTSVSQGSADLGAVVWSVVQESPGNDLPPEPAIRADATIPEKNLQLKMTIRRNADESLPASHILEIIFLTPDDFDGGGIDSVLRVSLKRSEQDTGNPLLGIPAKIADGFFLVALSDSTADTETNMLLLRRQSWIDIPVVYKSGRRALITIEKGIPGDKVFTDVLNAWQSATSG